MFTVQLAWLGVLWNSKTAEGRYWLTWTVLSIANFLPFKRKSRTLGAMRASIPVVLAILVVACVIERCVFDSLWISQNRNLAKRDFYGRFESSNLVKESIKRHGGLEKLHRKMMFARTFSEAKGLPEKERPAVFDVKELEKLGGLLSESCHSQLKPEKLGDRWGGVEDAVDSRRSSPP